MIKYINISFKEYYKLSDDERKEPYCIEYSNGDKDWRVNDLSHREDGPSAIIYHDGINYWYLNGIRYSFEEWCKILNKTDEEKIFLRLKYS